MASYNLGRANGIIRIQYDSSGQREVDRDLRRLEDELREINERHVDINISDADAQRTVHRVQESLEQLARERADPNVTLDDAEFRERFRAIRDQLNELNQANADPNVHIQLSHTELEQIRALQTDLQRLDRTTADPRIDIDTALAEAQLQGIQRQVNHLDGQEINITVDVRSQARAILKAIGLAAAVSAAAVGILQLALAGLAAVEGILAVVTAGVAAIGAAAVAAGAGTAVFAGAVITVLKPVVEAYKNITKAQKAYNDATDDKGRQKALEDLKAAVQGLDDNQKKLVLGLFALKGAWMQLTDSVKPEIYDIAGKSLGTITNLLPKLQPLLKNTAGAYGLLAEKIDQTANGPGAKKFLNFLTKESPFAILSLSHSLGGLGGIFAQVFEGFSPLIRPAEQSLIGFVDRWLAKSKNLEDNASWKHFLDFIRTTAPQVGEAFGSIGGAVGHLLVALEPLVGPALDFVTRFFNAIKRLTDSSGFKLFVGDVARVLGTLGDVISGDGDNTNGFLATFGNAIADLLDAVAPLVPHLKLFLTNIAKLIDKIVTSPGFAHLVESIANGLDKLGNALAHMDPRVIDAIFNSIAKLVDIAASIASAGNGLGLLAAAVFTLGINAGRASGPVGGLLRLLTGRGGLALLGRIAIPIGLAITVAKTATLAQDLLKDIRSGNWQDAVQKGLRSDIAKAFTGGLSGGLADAVKDGFHPEKIITGTTGYKIVTSLLGIGSSDSLKYVEDQGVTTARLFWESATDTSTRTSKAFLDSVKGGAEAAGQAPFWALNGADGGKKFAGAVAAEAPNSHAAGAGLGKAATDGLQDNAPFWAPKGQSGARAFWEAANAEKPNSRAAGSGVAAQAVAGLQSQAPFWAPKGSDGGSSFWRGVQSQQGNAGNAGRGLANAATGGAFWNGSGQGSRGGFAFWQGVSSQAAGAAAAGAQLAGAARGGASGWAANFQGSNLAAQYADGIRSQIGAVSAAAGAIAAAVRNMVPSSPAKDPRSPFHGLKNAPHALGASLAMQYAQGMRSQISAVRSASRALASSAYIDASGNPGALLGAASARQGVTIGASAASAPTVVSGPSKSVTFSPTYQYVGPTPAQVVQDSQRELDWRYGT